MHETEIHSNTIEKLKRGSYEAFDTLYDMYADSLYGFALLHTKSSVQAEDIVQDTFLKLWNMRASLSVEGSFKSMLFTIAKNHVIDVFRQQINRPDFEDYIRFCEDEHLLDNTSVEKIYFSEENKDQILALLQDVEGFDKSYLRLSVGKERETSKGYFILRHN